MADGNNPKPAVLSEGELFAAMQRKQNADKVVESSPEKEAPIVAPIVSSEETPRAKSADPEIATEFQRIRKPRNPDSVTSKVVDKAKSVINDVKASVSFKAKSPEEMDSLRRKVIAEDSMRMKAVRRYAKTAKAQLRSVIRGVLVNSGIANVKPEIIDNLVIVVRRERVQAGYCVVKGEIVPRELSVEQMLAYTLGHYKVALDIKGAEQWVKHPTVFDVLTVIAGVGMVGYDVVKGSISEHIPSIFDGTFGVNAEKVKGAYKVAKETPSIRVSDTNANEPV